MDVRRVLSCTHEMGIKLNRSNCPKLDVKNPFTLSAEVLLTHLEGKSLIMRQEGLFSLEINDGEIEFNLLTEEGYQKVLGYDLKKLDCKEKEWLYLDLVYENYVLKLYFKGRLCESFPQICPGSFQPLSGTSVSWELGFFDGFFKYAGLYSRALTDKEMLQRLLRLNGEEGQQLLLDFELDRYFLVPGKKANIQFLGACDMSLVVPCLNPGKTGFSQILDDKKISLTNEGKTSFTLLVYLYNLITPAREWEQALFSQGNTEKTDFCFGLSAGTGNLFLTIGGERMELSCTLTERVWVCAAVVVNRLEVKVYINGKEMGVWNRKEEKEVIICNPMIGNQRDQSVAYNHGFDGYINRIALFDRNLEEEKIAHYVHALPTVYSQHLLASWLFEEGNSREEKSGGRLIMTDSSFILAEGTMKDIPNDLTFDIPSYTGELTDSDKSQLILIADASASYLAEMLGMSEVAPIEMSEDNLRILAGILYADESNQGNTKEVNGNEVLIGIICGGGTGAVIGLLYSLYKKCCYGPGTPKYEKWGWKKILGYAALGFVLGVLGGGIVGHIISKSRKNPTHVTVDPSAPELRHVEFNCEQWESTGVLCADRIEVGDKKTHLILACCKDNQGRKPKITFSFLKNKEVTETAGYELRIYQYDNEIEELLNNNAGNDALKNKAKFFKNFSFDLNSTGETRAVVELETFHWDKLNQFSNSVKLVYELNKSQGGKKIMTGNILLDFCILDNPPKAPWETGEHLKYLPALEMARLFREIWGAQALTGEVAFADAFVEWYGKQKFQTSLEEVGDYGYKKKGEAVFQINRFAEKWKDRNGKPKLTPLEAQCLMLSLIRLQGWANMKLRLLSTMEPDKALTLKKGAKVMSYPVTAVFTNGELHVWDPGSAKNLLYSSDDSEKVKKDNTFRDLLCEKDTACRMEPGALTLTFREKEAPPDLSVRPYGIVVIDTWDNHGCNGAANCVNELSKKINTILMDLEKKLGETASKNARIVLCPSDIRELEQEKKEPSNMAELRNKTVSQTVKSDYHIGVRQRFSFKPGLPGQGHLDGLSFNQFLEFDSKPECDCSGNHNNYGTNRLNEELRPFWKTIKTGDDTKVLMGNVDEIITYLKDQSVRDVFLMGVHTNMCMVFRKCGILQLLSNDFQVWLVRDLTDARMSRFCYPYQEHFEATDTVIEYLGNTPISIGGQQKTCGLVTSQFFSKDQPLLSFAKDFRFPEKSLTGNKGELLDFYEEYRRCGRPGFPIGVYWREGQEGIAKRIDGLVFEYANEKGKNRRVLLGHGLLDTEYRYQPFEPGEYIEGIKLYFNSSSAISAEVLTGLELFTTTRSSSLILGSKDAGKTEERFANRKDRDYFGNRDYAFLCPQMTVVVKNGEQYLTGLEFYSTIYNRYLVGKEERLRVDFLYHYIIFDGRTVKAYEHYAFVFFEGEFYLYERGKEGKYTFMRRTESLAIQKGTGNTPSGYSLDARLMEFSDEKNHNLKLPILVPNADSGGSGEPLETTFQWKHNVERI